MDKKGNYMIMSKTGVFFFDPASRTCKRKTNSSPDLSSFYQYEVFNVLNDNTGYYWIATNKRGLMRFDPVTKKTISLALPFPLKKELLRFDVVVQDSYANIWAGSNNGLFKINPATLATDYFSSDIRTSNPQAHQMLEHIPDYYEKQSSSKSLSTSTAAEFFIILQGTLTVIKLKQ